MMVRSPRRSTMALVSAAIAWTIAGCAGAPPAPTTADASRPDRAAALFTEALSAQDAGDDARAAVLLNDVIALTPERAAPHTNLGIIYRRTGRFDEAIREYESAIRINPADAEAYHNLGLAHRRRGAFADAERAYLRALELRPNQVDTRYNLGILYDLYLDRPQDALVQYRTILDLGGPDVEMITGWIRTLERRSTRGAVLQPTEGAP
jgi:Flp pilus assembly protein TadD